MPTAYITAPPDAAPAIAETLVEERLAACVNRTECRSVYRWEGEVHDELEVILLAKTTEDRYPALVDRVEAVHPHETPCIERFDEDGRLGAFADWRAEAVRSPGGSGQ